MLFPHKLVFMVRWWENVATAPTFTHRPNGGREGMGVPHLTHYALVENIANKSLKCSRRPVREKTQEFVSQNTHKR